MKLDVVDTQVHIGPGKIEETLAAMNALGISAILIDEYWLKNFFAYEPHHVIAGGESRPICPTAELAAQMYPDRFAWVLRINYHDPEYDNIIRMVKESPFGKGIRLIPGMNPMDIQAFADGAYDHILASAEKYGLPLFLYLPDHPELIERCAKQYPQLTMIVDHCGLYSNAMRRGLSKKEAFTSEQQMQMFERVLQLSAFPNVYLKWAHYSTMFDIPAFPGEGLRDILRKAIQSFGADRILWASDFSVNQSGENWGELLYSMKCNSELTEEEMTNIMGANARRILAWDNQ